MNFLNLKVFRFSLFQSLYFRFILLFSLIFIVSFSTLFASGKTLVSDGDAILQMIPAMQFFGEYLRSLPINLVHFQIPQFEESLIFGADIFQTLHYYVIGDPFMLLCAFFPKSAEAVCFSIVYFLKLMFLGIALISFLKNHLKSEIAIYSAALCYSFSLYAIKIHWELLFINAAIFLPFCMRGVDKVIAFINNDFQKYSSCRKFAKFSVISKKSLCLIVPLSLNFLCADLMSEQVLFFTVCYAIVKHRKQVKSLLFLLPALFFSLLLPSIFLLPSTIGLLNSPRVGFGFCPLFYTLTFYLKFLTPWTTQFGGDVEDIYSVCPIFLVALVVVFAKRKQLTSLKIAAVLVFAAMLSPQFAFLMAAFQAPKNRYLYIFALFASICIGFLVEKSSAVSQKVLICVSAITLLSALALQMINFNTKQYSSNLICFVFIAGAVLVIILAKTLLPSQQKILPLVIFASVVVWIPVSTLTYFKVHQTNDKSELNFYSSNQVSSFFENSPATINQKIANPNEFSRYSTASFSETINSGFANGQNSLNSYLNNPQTTLIKFRNNLGLYSHMGIPWNMYDSEFRPDSSSILGVKNYITKDAITSKTVGEEKRISNFRVQKNLTAFPFANLTSSLSLKNYFSSFNYKIVESNFVDFSNNKIIAKQPSASITFEIENDGDDIWFVGKQIEYSPLVWESETSLGLFNMAPYSDKFVSSKIRFKTEDDFSPSKSASIMSERYEYALKSQNFVSKISSKTETENKNTKITLSFSNPGTFNFSEFSFSKLNEDELMVDSKIANENSTSSNQKGLNKYFGTFKITDENSNLKYISTVIPYFSLKFLGIEDSAWEAKIDGKKASVLPSKIALSAIELPDNLENGEHTFELKYHSPFFLFGNILTLLSLLLLLLCLKTAKQTRPSVL